jgi:flagella basal body P-ring formation protein FlgA
MTVFFQIVMLGFAATVCAVEPMPQVSIVFRDSATVNDTVIRLGDIAVIGSEASPEKIEKLKNAVVGEAAPAGYCRKVSTEEVGIFVLKKDFSEFSFDKIQRKAIKVATAYQEKRVGDFEDIIIKSLADSVKWKPSDFTIALRNKDEKWKCLRRPLTIQIIGLSSKYPKGNVNIKLVARQDSKTFSVPVVCCVTVVTPVVTVRTAVPRGTSFTSSNCMLERKDITHFACNPFTDLSQLNDLIANRTIQPETILYDKLTSRLPIIGKDDQVYVVMDRGRVRVSIIMRAREQGAMGDKIWVENELTHKLLKTKIIGKGKVELLEGVKTI